MCTCGRRKASNEETSLWFKESLGMEFKEAVKLLTWAQSVMLDPSEQGMSK